MVQKKQKRKHFHSSEIARFVKEERFSGDVLAKFHKRGGGRKRPPQSKRGKIFVAKVETFSCEGKKLNRYPRKGGREFMAK